MTKYFDDHESGADRMTGDASRHRSLSISRIADPGKA